MPRKISRRDFAKQFAAGAALLALPHSWHSPAGAQSVREDLRGLGGELSVDDATLQAAADDFGRVVHKRPLAVLKPSAPDDIAKLIQYANRRGLKVAMRGRA